jgi:hypothetical protein
VRVQPGTVRLHEIAERVLVSITNASDEFARPRRYWLSKAPRSDCDRSKHMIKERPDEKLVAATQITLDDVVAVQEYTADARAAFGERKA